MTTNLDIVSDRKAKPCLENLALTKVHFSLFLICGNNIEYYLISSAADEYQGTPSLGRIFTSAGSNVLHALVHQTEYNDKDNSFDFPSPEYLHFINLIGKIVNNNSITHEYSSITSHQGVLQNEKVLYLNFRQKLKKF